MILRVANGEAIQYETVGDCICNLGFKRQMSGANFRDFTIHFNGQFSLKFETLAQMKQALRILLEVL